MDRGTRRPRTRGPRRGRGVRVRGGRTAGPGPSLSTSPVPPSHPPASRPASPRVVILENVLVAPGRTGRGGRGQRGGHARRTGRAGYGSERPGPRTIEELVVRDISELPPGHVLETPIHAKRMRMWQPSVPAASTPPLLSLASLPLGGDGGNYGEVASTSRSATEMPAAPTPPPQLLPLGCNDGEVASSSRSLMDVECASPSPLPLHASPLPAYSVSLPATYLERGQASTPPASSSTSSSMQPPPPRHRPRQNLRDEDIANLLYFGSDAESDESDEGEDLVVLPVIPRVLRAMLTPWNPDENSDDQGAGEGGSGAAPAVDSASAADPASDADPALSATDQPWSFFDFQWKEFPIPPISPESRREKFSQNNVGPTIPDVDPYDIFVAIWDRQIMEYIASETNRYSQQVADQMLKDHNLHPSSRIVRWCHTTADELYVYFGLILAMGIVVKSKLEDYWCATSDVFSTPGFCAHMSFNRFTLITKCLHFINNEDMCAQNLNGSEARLFKIRPLLSHLNSKFQNLYILSQNIALDESLLMWKGWLDISQLIPNKAARKGIKTYEICESRTGYLWRFEIHAQSKSARRPPEPENPLERVTPAIVLRLTQGLEHKGYTLWMDNFYNSPSLARRLKTLGFDCVGTLRTDRQFLPEALHSLTKGRMREGQITGLTSGDVDVMIWRDANRVAMISTYHGNAIQTVQESTKPILIHDYNIMMGGVDKKDQLLAMYPIERKRTKVWYKKLFRRLLNVSVLNSFIIHCHNSSSTSSASLHRKFRISLIKSLLSKHLTPAPSLPRAIPQNMTHDVTHHLDMHPIGKTQRIRRTCVVCKKKVHMFCVGCDQTVCFGPCFLTLHTK